MMHNNSFGLPDLDIGKQFQKTLQDLSQAIRPPALPKVTVEQFRLQIKLPQSFSKFLEELRKQSQAAEALDEVGWLPHYTTPFHCIEACAGDSERISNLLTKHYQEQWPTVREGIEKRLTGYCLDDEAKETFEEALKAHEQELYRCVCRVLFPEIEGVVRKELFGNKTGQIQFKSEMSKAGMQLPARSVNTGMPYTLNLFERLLKHFYKSCQDNESRLRFSQDPIPNRHAAIHGLVSYSTAQNSLNTIFMADFLFEITCALKQQQTSQAKPKPDERP